MALCMKHHKILDTKKLPGSLIEIKATIPEKKLTEYRSATLKDLLAKAELPGFRKGKVPEKTFVDRVGEMTILEEAAERAINDSYYEILDEEKIEAIASPKLSITKLTSGADLEFTLTITVMPKVKLPDYKKIAREENTKPEEKFEATDADLEEAKKAIRHHLLHAEGGQDHSHHNHKDEELPELTDDVIKKFGPFKDMSDFESKLRENIVEEKRRKDREKRRIALSDALAAGTEVDLPQALVESEIAKMEGQFRTDIEAMGVKPEDYVKHAKKTWEEIRKDWEPSAKKRATLQLAIHEIARAEKIEATKEEIEGEVKHLLEHYKDADLFRTKVYVTNVIINQKTFEFLESVK